MKQNPFPADLEKISALADGQLRGNEFAGALATLSGSDEAIAAWHAYHVTGDVLRCGDLADCSCDMAFLERLRSRLPDAVRPGAHSGDDLVDGREDFVAVDRSRLVRGGANDPATRWKWLAGFASLVAVSVVGWGALGFNADSGAVRQLADGAATSTMGALRSGAPAPMAGSTEAAVMLRDPRLDELLAAHKQFGGTSALQMPAGFLRNATFANPGR